MERENEEKGDLVIKWTLFLNANMVIETGRIYNAIKI